MEKTNKTTKIPSQNTNLLLFWGWSPVFASWRADPRRSRRSRCTWPGCSPLADPTSYSAAAPSCPSYRYASLWKTITYKYKGSVLKETKDCSVYLLEYGSSVRASSTKFEFSSLLRFHTLTERHWTNLSLIWHLNIAVFHTFCKCIYFKKDLLYGTTILDQFLFPVKINHAIYWSMVIRTGIYKMRDIFYKLTSFSYYFPLLFFLAMPPQIMTQNITLRSKTLWYAFISYIAQKYKEIIQTH